MPEPKRERLLFILRQTDLARDVTAFVVDRQARGLSQRSVDYYSDELRYLCAYLEGRGVGRVQDVTADMLRQYLVELGQRRNPGGVHCAYRVAKTFLRWVWTEYELAPACPIVKVRAPKLPQEPLEPVPLPDLRKMLATCARGTFTGDRDRALLLALLDSGCRAGEFLALDVADVNLSTGSVIIRKGKGGKFRTAFLGARTRREVMRYLRHTVATSHHPGTGALWVTVQGGRLTLAGLRQVVRRRALAAGVAIPSLHSFRRAFALACLRGGMDVYSLQRLMGHAGLDVLRRYLRQTEQDLQQAHARSGPVDRLLSGRKP
jgi:site-specific recombinase XerD